MDEAGAGATSPISAKKLKQAGLPDDLKYLAVAESGLLKNVRSWAGAVGVWQFVPSHGPALRACARTAGSTTAATRKRPRPRP